MNRASTALIYYATDDQSGYDDAFTLTGAA